jgi:hypothetical protein
MLFLLDLRGTKIVNAMSATFDYIGKEAGEKQMQHTDISIIGMPVEYGRHLMFISI